MELPLDMVSISASICRTNGVTVTCKEDKAAWWAAHADILPHWSSLPKTLLLSQPSSASAERAFSILPNAFNAQQDRTFQDYLGACVMFQYNNNKGV